MKDMVLRELKDKSMHLMYLYTNRQEKSVCLCAYIHTYVRIVQMAQIVLDR